MSIAQKAIRFDVPMPENLKIPIPENSFKDSLMIFKTSQKIVNDLHKNGFLEANLDNVYHQDSLFFSNIHLGKIYQWLALDFEALPIEWESEYQNFRKVKGKLFNINDLENIQKEILGIAAEHAYPFAEVHFDHFRIIEEKVTASVQLKKKQLTYFHSIKMEGDTLLSNGFLTQYLNFKIGTLYRQSTINDLSKKISELNFVKEKTPFFLEFEGSKTILHLNLEKRPSSRFDVLLGLQPNTDDPGNTKLSLSGTATIDFSNLLKYGERFFFDFQRISPQTQQLKASFSMPYILNTPIGLETKFEGYKRQKEYFNANLEAAISYQISSSQTIKGYITRNSSTVLDVDKASLLFQRKLPQNLDIVKQIYGVIWKNEHLDYRYNPRKGFDIDMKFGLGRKEILKNNIIQNFVGNDGYSYRFLYDSIPLKSTQYQLEAHFDGYLPLGKEANTLKFGLKAATLFGNSVVQKNEQFLLGGLKTLRGFDDQSILANTFVVGTLEWRYLLSKNSFFSIFSDAASLLETQNEVQKQHNYISFGTGIVFETKLGLLNITYAIGKRDENPFDFKTGKVHFGYFILF